MSMSVSVYVCSQAYLQNYMADLYQIFERVTYGHGSVRLWQHCNMFCTSDFMDNIICAHSGPYGGISTLLQLVMSLHHYALLLFVGCVMS